MDLEELVRSVKVVELTAEDRSGAIRELVDAGDWEQAGIATQDILAAIEDREATAQTVVGDGLALPHAIIDWDGEFRMVLGRSRSGVGWLTRDEPLHLVVLLIVGRRRPETHLEVLAGIAELLRDEEFRQSLIVADHSADIRQRLLDRVAEQRRRTVTLPAAPRQSVEVTQQAVVLAQVLSAQAVLLAVDPDQQIPWSALRDWSGRLLVISAGKTTSADPGHRDLHVFRIPHSSLSRHDRAAVGLLMAAARGLLDDERDVVCVTGSRSRPLDSISVTRPAPHLRAVFEKRDNDSGKMTSPEVILRVMTLAIEISAEGREAHPVGTMFVVGDTRQVVRHTQQLVLNPFHGFARRLRNILDPSLSETVKEFALIDGAFLVESDGTIRSAGTYLVVGGGVSSLPGGLGARHQAAAGITADTRAIAVTVSQSTGTVTMFEGGDVVLTLNRASLTNW